MSRKFQLCIVFSLAFLVLWGAQSCNKSKESAAIKPLIKAPGPDFVSLFNGKDFSGWLMEPDSGAWAVENGVMHCKGKPHIPYIIRTGKEYENFDFYAEFKVSKGCNSGITFHVPIPGSGRESKMGFEAQILDDAGKPPTIHSTGSVYSVIAPKMNAMKPAGEWNQYHVLINWPECKIWLNGELIQDADFSAIPELKYRLRKGYIGLTNHGHVVDYRNLWVKELPAQEKWIELFNGKDLNNWQKIGNADWHIENGLLVATKGEGYLVTKDEYKDFYFQAYVNNDTLQTRGGGFYYRWKSVVDPGYMAEFFDFTKARESRVRLGVEAPYWKAGPIFDYQWMPYQIISSERFALVRTAGSVTSTELLLNKVRAGKIAIYHSPADGVIELQRVKIKRLE